MTRTPPVDTRNRPLPDDLPTELVAYRQSPVFTQDTIPEALKRNHSTKAGVWAVIHILEGALHYRIEEPASAHILTPEAPGLVRPEQEHNVSAQGPVRFVVEFYALPGEKGDPHTQTGG